MKFLISSKSPESVVDEAVVIPIYSEIKPQKSLSKPLQQALSSGDFKAEANQLFSFYPESEFKAKRVIYISLGKESEVTLESIRRAFHSVQKKLNSVKVKSFAVALPKTKFSESDVARAIAESLMLSNYAFDKYKSEEKEQSTRFSQVTFLASPSIQKSLDRAVIVCNSTNMVRDLVNENSKDKNALILESFARKLAKECRLKITVLTEKDMKKLGMNLILAVSSGSPIPPRLIFLEYHGNAKSKDVYALVGKGIGFDSGGLNLKPTGYMETMRTDMAGAATVFGILRTAAELKLNINLVGVAPLCENVVSGFSFKPGDVFTAYNGKTVEIGNTDAEGRLILADALSYTVKKYNPTLTIDLATLTGACVVALGERIAGVMGNNDDAIKNVVQSGKDVGEHLHELPLFADYNDSMKGTRSDLNNISSNKGDGGAITGGLFLQNFVDKKPWVHIDMAGPAYMKTEYHYVGPNATGFALRTIIKFFETK